MPESPAIGTRQVALPADGHIAFTNVCMRGMGHGRRLMKMGIDGGAPADMLGPKVAKYSVSGEMYVALSPDGLPLEQMSMPGAVMVALNRESGALYVLRRPGPSASAGSPRTTGARSPGRGGGTRPTAAPGPSRRPRISGRPRGRSRMYFYRLEKRRW